MLPAIWNVEMRHCLICLPISGSSATREKNVLRAPLARLAIDGAGNRVGDPPVLRQVPGGWNRIHLQVADLEAEVKRLRATGVSFRTSEIVTGPDSAQVIIDDPSGNPIELFQPRQ
jgi:hypothetical protein